MDSKYQTTADSGDRAVEGIGLRQLACWYSGFESRKGARMLVSCERCVSSALRRVDHSSRGVLQSVMCLNSVIVKPRKGRS
jgi:hypothetical protein